MTEQEKTFAARLKAYLDEHGIPKHKHVRNRIDDFELLRNYLAVRNHLKRIPIEFEVGKLGKYSKNNYRHHFGSYDTFLEIIGEKDPTKPKPIPKSAPPPPHKESSIFELMREYEALSNRLGRPAKLSDIAQLLPEKVEDYRKTFGDLSQPPPWFRMQEKDGSKQKKKRE